MDYVPIPIASQTLVAQANEATPLPHIQSVPDPKLKRGPTDTTQTVPRATTKNKLVGLMAHFSYNFSGCNDPSRQEIRILNNATKGEITIARSDYKLPDGACAGLVVPLTVVVYNPGKDFVGQDEVLYEVLSLKYVNQKLEMVPTRMRILITVQP